MAEQREASSGQQREASSGQQETFCVAARYRCAASRIGSGAFSDVFKAVDLTNNETVAVKRIDLAKVKKSKRLRAELEIMRSLTHPNIVHMLDVHSAEPHYVYLVLEYCQGGDLSHLLKRRHRTGLGESEALDYFGQLVEAVKYRREVHGIVDRDIKPQNILLTSDGRIKLTDFGFSRVLAADAMAETVCGSPLYMAPEILAKQVYSDKSDLWSLGAVLYELLVGTPPYRADNIVTLLHEINKGPPRIPSHLSPSIEDLLRGLLQRNECQRIGWRELFEHECLRPGSCSSTESMGYLSSAPLGIPSSPTHLQMSGLSCSPPEWHLSPGNSPGWSQDYTSTEPLCNAASRPMAIPLDLSSHLIEDYERPLRPSRSAPERHHAALGTSSLLGTSPLGRTWSSIRNSFIDCVEMIKDIPKSV
jgi:serine/threonine-protein kinase ULK/ATG1